RSSAQPPASPSRRQIGVWHPVMYSDITKQFNFGAAVKAATLRSSSTASNHHHSHIPAPHRPAATFPYISQNGLGSNSVARPRKLDYDDEKTQDVVRGMAGLGMTIPEIASVFGVSHDTIETRFGDQIKLGWADMKMSIKRAQFTLGVNKLDRTMLI